MFKRFVATCGIVISAVGMLPSESKAMYSYNQDIIFVGCTISAAGTSGMTVYSVEAFGANGKWIATDLGATKAATDSVIGQSCSGTLNKLIGSTKGCASGMNWALMYQPSFNVLDKSGYALNLFSLMCDYSSASPM